MIKFTIKILLAQSLHVTSALNIRFDKKVLEPPQSHLSELRRLKIVDSEIVDMKNPDWIDITCLNEWSKLGQNDSLVMYQKGSYSAKYYKAQH